MKETHKLRPPGRIWGNAEAQAEEGRENLHSLFALDSGQASLRDLHLLKWREWERELQLLREKKRIKRDLKGLHPSQVREWGWGGGQVPGRLNFKSQPLPLLFYHVHDN